MVILIYNWKKMKKKELRFKITYFRKEFSMIGGLFMISTNIYFSILRHSDNGTVFQKQGRRKVQKFGGGGTTNRLSISASVLFSISAKSGGAKATLTPPTGYGPGMHCSFT